MTEPHRFPVDVLILLQRPDGRILLTKRAGSVYLAGSWAVPGGKVDADEDVITAAIRELHEETGVTVTHDQLTFIGVTHHRPPHHDSRIGFGFLATDWISEPRNVEPDKCSQLAWFPPDELPDPTMPYTAEVIRLHQEKQRFSLHDWWGIGH
ncbi:NUDIX domain-containing protein [Salinispora oceanensis]|uniref:NUDIX domain-containing protein n=1 Tax=Salinispora oceanensis TaxID=1050199 RepID=UPI000370FFE6|nr:NUDIX domain-containing protein [Salinispora oceanensis]